MFQPCQISSAALQKVSDENQLVSNPRNRYIVVSMEPAPPNTIKCIIELMLNLLQQLPLRKQLPHTWLLIKQHTRTAASAATPTAHVATNGAACMASALTTNKATAAELIELQSAAPNYGNNLPLSVSLDDNIQPDPTERAVTNFAAYHANVRAPKGTHERQVACNQIIQSAQYGSMQTQGKPIRRQLAHGLAVLSKHATSQPNHSHQLIRKTIDRDQF